MSECAAALRSELYALLACLLAYPDEAWLADIRAGLVADRLTALCARLDVGATLQPQRAALCDAGEGDEALAAEYTRLFDTGPISLYGGHHHGTRMQVMEEVLRYFEHFGLELDPDRNELPDHLVCELEFMHFLCQQEAHLPADQQAPWQRAQRDYLARQLGRWAPRLHGLLLAQQAHAFFVEVARLLAVFLASEQQRLDAQTI